MKQQWSKALWGIGLLLGMLTGCASNQIALSSVTPTIQPTARIYPTAWTTATPFISQPLPTLTVTPIPSDWPLPPTNPVSVTAYVDLLTNFINAQPTNYDHLGEVLALWTTSTNRMIIQQPEGEYYRKFDFNRDGQAEILITLPANHPALLILLTPDINGVYQPTWKLVSDSINDYRIWLVRDLTADGHAEIVMGASACGAHTCFQTINMLQWQPTTLNSILELSAANPTVLWSDLTADGSIELIVNRGNIGSDGAGMQRKQTEIYQWDGSRYILNSITPDPVVSQHPYWQLLDGFAALADDKLESAHQLFSSASNAQPPFPAIGIEGSNLQLTIAIARFQAIYTALLAGDNPSAQILYDQAQQNDGDYRKWTAAFMSTYQQTNDLAAACLAAQASATEGQYLIGFSYQHRALPIRSLLCGQLP